MAFITDKEAYKIWVFAPFLDTNDPTLQAYYDYTQSIAEFEKVFSELSCEWEWVNITIQNLNQEINRVKSYNTKKSIVINLCDGDEINQVPGVSVIHALRANNLVFTGSEAYFYDVTTSKITMKEAFDKHAVVTPKWQKLNGHIDKNIFGNVGVPLIVKPAVSAGSMGISINNVVNDTNEMQDTLNRIKNGYKGWKLDGDGLLAEQFIIGREFTVLMVGSYHHPEAIKFYQPVERVFHPALPEKEQFLSFDRLWANYVEETRMPNDDDFYDYAPVTDVKLVERIKQLSLKAYESVKGTGYTRIDIRMDKVTGELYVLEVNAQCGLSADENYTSIGAILRFNNKTFTDLIVEVLDDALARPTP
jgi:D-alanine-D-alanine ligase